MRLILILSCFFSAAVGATEVVEDPLERQMLEIAGELRCAVCQNQPVSESNADLARDMRAIILEQLQAGKTREEIKDYFVARYGDYVLLKPPYQASGRWVWLMPPVLLLLAFLFAWFYIRSRQRHALPPAPELSEEDAARVRAARRLMSGDTQDGAPGEKGKEG